MYLAMTLGPALLVPGWFSSARTALTRAMVTIGNTDWLSLAVVRGGQTTQEGLVVELPVK
jgi:hypothetical protein